jgi:hypothetical protein
MNRIMAPFAAPTKAVGLQGKSRRVRGSVSFGGSSGLVFLRLSPPHEVLPQRGHGLRPHQGGGLDRRRAARDRVHQRHHGPHS